MTTNASADWVSTGLRAELDEGEMVGVNVQDVPIAVYRVHGTLYATDNVCTHAYALLSDGWLDEAIVECPLHGGQFDVKSGKALGGLVTCNLRVFEVRVVEGVIEIALHQQSP
jgi:naphthalene 1,2-dioxygenase system ferredoxin subunit